MTYRIFLIIGILAAFFAIAPFSAISASAQYYDEFGSSYYDSLYTDIGILNGPYSVNYGSTYYDPYYRSPSYSNSYVPTYTNNYGSRYYDDNYRTTTSTRSTYRPENTMPGFRCYYWDRDGNCMNYSYRQAPLYYGGYSYGNNCGYRNRTYGYDNYSYGNYNYGNSYYSRGCY